ncbi:hypothetical protein CAI21_04470 [Alkalilimnicola ehrlichii]|uniref:DUF962 domain-containing protein n=1 Tax=Alkalilimnicola ehrlichii TaxID=351052 RepID=A0A3E0WZR6_9GAMM|nr:Mpo1-like protein [Alkalilimnicola ehrlichii]RFA30768.1 hypothetical protein CAI21_04470 [Alkalilimnicola ehrlichii]RFA38344.1 hypothetical protein CAL65_05835 [Alkalilimnicola ehrlichii]
MKTIDQWFDEYGESHKNPTNKLIHWICVPLITFSVIGLLWSVPVPTAMAAISPLLNWAVIFSILAGFFYLRLSVPIFLAMAVMTIAFLAICYALAQSSVSLLWLSIAIFVGAWIGQFIGHKIEGKKPSFFKDLQFLLVGPAWLLGFVYRALGLKY